MTYEYKTGDIFNTTLTYIGHGVNLQPNMNGGIARIISLRWPLLYEEYVQACESGELRPGGVVFIPVTRETENDTIIANLASQILPGANAQMDLLEQSLREAITTIQEAGGEGLAIPRIGAGIGGLEWDDVKALFEFLAEEAGDDFLLEIWSLPDAV